MKLLFFALVVSYFFGQQAISLPLFKGTDQFKIFCTSTDQGIAHDILTEAEAFWGQLVSDFKNSLNTKINIEIYSDLKSFHQAINWLAAPEWVVNSYDGTTIKTVSPHNPGPLHTYDSVMNANKAGLVSVFICGTYANHTLIPRWLHQGVALYKANFFSNNIAEKLIKDISSFPTLEQLENIAKEDDSSFDQVHGFAISYSMVQFIVKKWGWNSILNLLADYSRFEEILNVSKQDFKKQWIISLYIACFSN